LWASAVSGGEGEARDGGQRRLAYRTAGGARREGRGRTLGVVRGLVELVTNGVTSGLETGADGGVRVLGDLLVSLLGGGSSSSLNGLGDVVYKSKGRVGCQPLRQMSRRMEGRASKVESWKAARLAKQRATY
jgi:hypothetical protein